MAQRIVFAPNFAGPPVQAIISPSFTGSSGPAILQQEIRTVHFNGPLLYGAFAVPDIHVEVDMRMGPFQSFHHTLHGYRIGHVVHGQGVMRKYGRGGQRKSETDTNWSDFGHLTASTYKRSLRLHQCCPIPCSAPLEDRCTADGCGPFGRLPGVKRRSRLAAAPFPPIVR